MATSDHFRDQMAGLLLDAKAASSLRDQLEASRKNAALWKADYARMMEKRDAAEEKAITQAKQIAALTALSVASVPPPPAERGERQGAGAWSMKAWQVSPPTTPS